MIKECISLTQKNQSGTDTVKEDGTVVSTTIEKDDEDFGQTVVYGWKDIVAISAGMYHTLGLKKDGTVISTNSLDSEGKTTNFGQTDVEKWPVIKMDEL